MGIRIVHLSTYYTVGGAALAAFRLHAAMRRLGYDSTMLVREPQHLDDDPVLSLQQNPSPGARLLARLRTEWLSRRFARHLRSRSETMDCFSFDRSPYGRQLVRQLPPADVINLHWVAEFLDYESFFTAVPKSVPVVWRLADMNPFTGGCHFDCGCGKYAHGCGSCPQLLSRNPKDLSSAIWRRKQAVFRRVDPSRLHLVALSRWMANTLAKSPLLSKFPVTIIPNGVDTDIFRPLNRAFAREALNLANDTKWILFLAHDTQTGRKGFAELRAALRGLDDPTVSLLSVGPGNLKVDSGHPHLHLGPIVNPRSLPVVYSAADLFVVPSLQDNFPNAVLESMACGTPVVGFATGGIPDMVRNGATGITVPTGDASALRLALAGLLKNPALRSEMSADCRRTALAEYSRETQVRRYLDLYQRVIAGEH